METDSGQTDSGTPERRISRGAVRLYKEYMGRGPTSARTHIAGDVVTCVLHDSMTKAETKLTEEGRVGTVRDIRREFQHAMAGDLIELAGEIMDRPVASLLSDHDPEQDVAVEVWVLEPRPDGI
jgi:uncharacterized protein YbcI